MSVENPTRVLDAAPLRETLEATRRAGFQLEAVTRSEGDVWAAPDALEALAADLVDGETLAFVYLFDPEQHPTARMAVELEGDVAPDRLAALAHAAEIACPGFAPRPLVRAVAPIRTPLAPPALDVTALVSGRGEPHRAPVPRVVDAHALDQLLIARRWPGPERLALVLASLDRLRFRGAFAIEIRPHRLEARELRALEHVRQALVARSAAGRLDGRQTGRVDDALDVMAQWAACPGGTAIQYVLTGEGAQAQDLADTVAAMLFGPGRGDQAQPRALDLSRAVPGEARLPALGVDFATLARSGFRPEFRRPRPRRDGLVLGVDGAGAAVAIPRSDLSRHLYIVGATGVGKSTLIASMIRQDVAEGHPFILVDPHGDLFAEVRGDLPSADAERAIVADVGDLATPFSMNLLDIRGEHAAVERNFVANQLISIFKSVLYQKAPEAFGPIFEAYFRNALFLLMESGGPEVNLADFDQVFSSREYRCHLLSQCENETVSRFWRDIATRAGGEASLENIAPYICSKLTQFTGNPVIRPIIARRCSTLDWPTALSEGRPVLINLAKGRVGGPDAALVGGLVTTRLFAAALARADVPRAERRPVRVYLDEFQNYTPGLDQMLAECRKFGLEMVLANQSLHQIDDRGVAQAVLANAGSVVCFRTGPEDAHCLAERFAPEYPAHALQALPDRNFVGRLLDAGRPCRPVLARTVANDAVSLACGHARDLQ